MKNNINKEIEFLSDRINDLQRSNANGSVNISYMPKIEIPEIEMEAPSPPPPLELTATSTIEKSVVAPVSPEEMVMPALTQEEKDGKRIRRIIFFYEDKTFEVFDA